MTDLTLLLAGDNSDLNGPAALPVCIVWFLAAIVAGYYRWQYGAGVGQYMALCGISSLIALLQLILFLVVYKDASVAMTRHIIAALTTMLLFWMMASMIGHWCGTARFKPLYSMQQENTTEKSKVATSNSLPKLSLSESANVNVRHLLQPISSTAAPCHVAPPSPLVYPAYYSIESLRRLRSCISVVHASNILGFSLILVGRGIALLESDISTESSLSVLGGVLELLVIMIITTMSFIGLRGYCRGLPSLNSSADQNETLQTNIRRTKHQLWLIILLALLLVPRCVSVILRSVNFSAYLAGEVCTAIWLCIVLLPGVLARFSEYSATNEVSMAERGLAPTNATPAAPATESNERKDNPEESPEDEEERASREAWRRTLTFSSTEHIEGLANTLRISSEERAPSPPTRFGVTTRLARTQSSYFNSENRAARRASFANLKRAASMAMPRMLRQNQSQSTSNNDDRKRWTIDLEIASGESLAEVFQRELGLTLPEPAVTSSKHARTRTLPIIMDETTFSSR
jgi:hypothetical protein